MRNYFLHMITGNFGEILTIETSKDFLNFFADIDIREIDDLFKNEKNANNQ